MKRLGVLLGGLLFVLVSCNNDDEGSGYTPTPASLDIPQTFQQNILPPVIPADNPLTEEGIALGKRLFFDIQLHYPGVD